MEVLKILVPIVWAGVAALIGGILYRRSTASVGSKWARLTGAAAIAMVFFYGMYRFTPPSFTQCVDSGESIVEQSDIARVQSLAGDLAEKAGAARQACTDSQRRDDRCVEALDVLVEHGVQITAGLQHLHIRR